MAVEVESTFEHNMLELWIKFQFGNWMHKLFMLFLEDYKNKFAIFFLENYSAIAKESQVLH